MKAAFTPNATARDLRRADLHNVVFVFTEFSQTRLALKNTLILGASTATLGTALAFVIAYVTTRQAIAGHRVLGFLATAPVAIPGIVLGVGLFLSYTRPPLVLYGTLWILLLAYLTIELPAAYQQLQSAFAPSIPSWRRPAGFSAPRGCSRCATSPPRCCAAASSPRGASSSSA